MPDSMGAAQCQIAEVAHARILGEAKIAHGRRDHFRLVTAREKEKLLNLVAGQVVDNAAKIAPIEGPIRSLDMPEEAMRSKAAGLHNLADCARFYQSARLDSRFLR